MPVSLRGRPPVHGHTCGGKPSPEFYSWRAMIRRCSDKGFSAYAAYGGKGISFCERWGVFSNFLLDMGPRPVGTTLGRLDHKKDYAPENCEWQTYSKQNKNRRPPKQKNARGYYKRGQKFVATIGIGHKTQHLGCFNTAEEAHRVFLEARKKTLCDL